MNTPQPEAEKPPAAQSKGERDTGMSAEGIASALLAMAEVMQDAESRGEQVGVSKFSIKVIREAASVLAAPSAAQPEPLTIPFEHETPFGKIEGHKLNPAFIGAARAPAGVGREEGLRNLVRNCVVYLGNEGHDRKAGQVEDALNAILGPQPEGTASNRQKCPHGYWIGEEPYCSKCVHDFWKAWQGRDSILGSHSDPPATATSPQPLPAPARQQVSAEARDWLERMTHYGYRDSERAKEVLAALSSVQQEGK